MNSVSVLVSFVQGTMTIENKPFLEVCKTIFQPSHDQKLIPIKILFPKTGMILYADDAKFKAYIKNEISTEELVSATQCDEIFRNNQDLMCQDYGYVVEEGSLWMKRGYECILIHDDEYVTHTWNEFKFTKFTS